MHGLSVLGIGSVLVEWLGFMPSSSRDPVSLSGMDARKRAVVLAVLLGAFCGSAATAGVTIAMSDDHEVSVEGHVPTETREDHIQAWKATLAKSGKTLPPKAKLDKMSDQEIFEAMWDEKRKYVEPMDMPNNAVE